MDSLRLYVSSLLKAVSLLGKREFFFHYKRIFVYGFILTLLFLGASFGVVSLMTHYAVQLSHHFFSSSFLDNPYVQFFLKVVLFLSSIIYLFVFYKYVYLVCLSPLLGSFAEQIYSVVIRRFRPKVDAFFLIRRSIRLNAYFFVLEALIGFVLFFVRIFDVTALTYLISFLVTAYFLGVSYMDYGLELYQKTPQQSKQFSKSNKILSLLVGTTYLICFLIPVVGWAIAPVVATMVGVLAVSSLMEKEDTVQKAISFLNPPMKK